MERFETKVTTIQQLLNMTFLNVFCEYGNQKERVKRSLP